MSGQAASMTRKEAIARAKAAECHSASSSGSNKPVKDKIK